MALSCGRRRQRGRRAGDGGGGRHFHVHYHLPRRVCGASSPRFISLLSAWVLVPPALFLAVLVFLVLFVWFTLLYFLRSLWNKDGKGGFFERDSEGHGRDADGQHGEDVAEEGTEEKKASLKVSSELFAGDSASAEDCAKRFEIEEVRVNSDEPQDIQRGDDEQLIEEVIIFEIQRGAEAIVHSDGLPEKHQIQDLPIDWFEEETKSRYGIKSGDSFPTVLSAITSEFHDFSVKNGVERLTMDFLDERNQKEAVLLDTSSHCGIGNNHCKYSEEYFDDTEIPAPSSSEISDFIDKHETREVVLDDCGNDDTLIVLASKDGSAHDAILYDHKDNTSEQKDQNNLAGLVDSVVVLFNQQEEIQNAIVSDDSRIPEALLNIESSSIASTYCDSSDKHQNLQEVPDSLASGDNIDEVASLQSSVPENAEDKDERSNANCISKVSTKESLAKFQKLFCEPVMYF